MSGERMQLPTVFVLMLVLIVSGPAVAGVEDGARHTHHPDWMEPGLIDLEADLAKVREQGKAGVMLLFTTQGCTYCAEFIRLSLEDPVLRQRVQQHFVAIGLEIFDDAEMTDHHGVDLPIKKFAEQHKAGMAPTLLFFGPDNRLIHRAIGYQAPQRFARMLDYLVGDHYKSASFRDYLLEHPVASEADAGVYPALRDDPLFDTAPYALSRQGFPATEPLLVIFEKTGCADCAAFHADVLAHDDVRALLRRFQVVRLDASDDRTPVMDPQGKMTTPAQWFAREQFTRVPALLYASESGETVLKVDALVERQRMLNASGLVLERAYEKGWSYQRFARSKAIERSQTSP